MVDGYKAYDALCVEATLDRLGCWAHARRKFVEAQRLRPKGKTGKPDQALALINKLYGLERSLQDAAFEETHRVRQHKALPVLNQLHDWLEITLPRTAPGTTLGKALVYLHNQWSRLVHIPDERDCAFRMIVTADSGSS